MGDLISGLANPTAILDSFKNEAIKILNEIATKQADELVQGIIREQVTKNIETIFNSGYVQQAAASAFNSTIYPEYIRRLKNLEAFLNVSTEQDNGLREKLNALPADKRSAEDILAVLNEWANGLEPKMADIRAKMVGAQPSTESNVVGNIADILYGDKQTEDANMEKMKNADTNNYEATAAPTAAAPAAETNVSTGGLFEKGIFGKFMKKGGKRSTKKRRNIQRRKTIHRY